MRLFSCHILPLSNKPTRDSCTDCTQPAATEAKRTEVIQKERAPQVSVGVHGISPTRLPKIKTNKAVPLPTTSSVVTFASIQMIASDSYHVQDFTQPYAVAFFYFNYSDLCWTEYCTSLPGFSTTSDLLQATPIRQNLLLNTWLDFQVLNDLKLKWLSDYMDSLLHRGPNLMLFIPWIHRPCLIVIQKHIPHRVTIITSPFSLFWCSPL